MFFRLFRTRWREQIGMLPRLYVILRNTVSLSNKMVPWIDLNSSPVQMAVPQAPPASQANRVATTQTMIIPTMTMLNNPRIRFTTVMIVTQKCHRK